MELALRSCREVTALMRLLLLMMTMQVAVEMKRGG